MSRPARALRVVVAVLVALAVVAPLAACGKKGDLDPPKDEKVRFPRQYPK